MAKLKPGAIAVDFETGGIYGDLDHCPIGDLLESAEALLACLPDGFYVDGPLSDDSLLPVELDESFSALAFCLYSSLRWLIICPLIASRTSGRHATGPAVNSFMMYPVATGKQPLKYCPQGISTSPRGTP